MTNLFTNLLNLSDSSRAHRVHTLALTVGSPSAHRRSTMLKLLSVLVLILILGVGNAWGDTYSWTLPFSTTTNGSRESDESEDATFNIKTSKGVDHGGTWTNQTKGSYFNVATGGYFILSIPINSSTTSFELEAEIYAWASKKYAAKNCTITYYTSKLSTPAAVCNGATTTSGCYSVDQTITLTASYKPASDGILYIKIAPDAGNIGFESLSVSTNAAASCSANPTVGTASLNGSFNMTSTTSAIGVQSGTCSTGNAACDWTDYGFVWSDGANTTTPTVSNNKVQVNTTGSATSWTGSVTPSGSTTPTSWTAGHTYYVRAYGKNSKASAEYFYGDAWSFTPRSITFHKNDGGATTSTQYVQGGVSTALTTNSFSRTGYTFAGWNTNADGTSGANYSNGQSVNLDANLDLYAKWTETLHDVTVAYKCGATTLQSSTTIEDVGIVTTGTTTAPASFTGYTWSTWSAMPSGVTTSTTPLTNRTIVINATADSKTITANYTANQYDITYKDQGGGDFSGTQTSAPTKHTYGTATTLKIPTKVGYDFGGWYTSPDCSTGAVGTSVSASLGATDYTNNIVLYAKWTLHDYTISSSLTNCTASPSIPNSYTYTGSAAGLSYTISPSSDMYGLPSTISVSGVSYTWVPATGVLTLTGTISSNVSITIAAQPKVIWMAGGQVFNTQQGASGTTLSNPGTPSSATYCDGSKTFVGWSASEIIDTQNNQPADLFTDATKKTIPAGGTTYYAVFATSSGTPSTSYAAITSGLTSGNYVIAYEFNNNSTRIALQNVQDGGNSTSKMEGYALARTDSKYANPADTYIWQLQKQNDGTYYIYDLATGLYLNATTSALQLSTTATKYDIAYDDTNSRWTIRLNSNNTYYVHGYVNNTTIDFRVSTSASDSRYRTYLYKNEGSQTFSAYATACCMSRNITLASSGSVTGGTFESSVSSACEDATVTLSATPSDGYAFSGWTVTKTEAPYTDITSTNVAGNTLTMPAYGVTVNASFTPTPTLTATGGDLSSTTLPFGTSCEQDEGTDKTFVLNGYSLTNDVTLTISGTDASMFSVKSPSSPIDKGTGRITDQTVTVTFTPTSTGTKTATLTIASSGASSIVLTLSGTAVKHYQVHYWNSGIDVHQESVLAGTDASATWDGVDDEDGCDTETYKYFVGWSKTNVGSTPTTTKPTIGETYTSVSSDVHYYAVWTDQEPSDNWVRYESSTIAEGDYLVVEKVSTSYYTMKNIISSNRTVYPIATMSGTTLTAPAAGDYDIDDFIWHIAPSATDGYYTIYSSDESKYLASNGTAKQIALVASPSDGKELFSYTYDGTYKTYSWINKYNNDTPVKDGDNVTAQLRQAGSGFALYKTTSNTQYLYYKPSGAKYITNCCDKNVTLATNSPANGTISFSPDGTIGTCGADAASRQTTMTVTPNAGYYLSTWSTSGVTPASLSTDIAYGSTSNSGAQATTVTFTQNTTTGTYTANATFSPIPVSSLTLHAIKKDNTSATIFEETSNNVALSLYPTEGKTASPADLLGHTVKIEFGAVLPANALNKGYTWSATVNGAAVGWSSNDLATNAVLEFNKSSGKVVAKAAGTAEIIITADDGSGITAKVTITVANVALSSLNVAKSSTTLYVGESEQIAVTYDPVNTTTKGYTTGSYTYVTIGRSYDKITLTGKAVTPGEPERVTLTSSDAGAKTATIDVTVKPLPKVTFVDNLQGKTDFSNWGSDGVVSSTVTDGVVTHTKPTPSHTDISDPGASYNACERSHLHLVGWIESTWADAHPSATHEQIVGANVSNGAGTFLEAGADFNVETYNGNTYYAVWSQVE